jgi:pyruvate/2-oxoglutarate dehydrogenase complex dihydrolipoamide dehydrogenase (E3) component
MLGETESSGAGPLIEPWDEHNRRLVSHVHPADWTNPQPQPRYDMVVVGAGTAGLVTAAAMAGIGKKVALIERHLMGGDCLNVGCVPSKALLRAARAVAEARDSPEFGVRLPKGYATEVDFQAVMERLRRLRSGIAHHDSAERFRDLGVDVFLGEGRFVERDEVEVAGARLRFKKACIATGGRAAAPPLPGLDGLRYLTNETVFSLTEKPARLAVLGAGPIGCEMAQAFARFGSEVYLIEALHGILPREDPEAAEIVQGAIEADGVRLLCCGKKTRFEKVPDGIRITLSSHGSDYHVTVSELLVAVGRAPNVEGLGLEQAGVAFDKKGVKVDDHLRTTNPNIFAAGDICFPFQFTHAADANARIVVQNALVGPLPFKAKASSLTIPWCTFTDPEIAYVGRYPSELEKTGAAFETVRIELADVDRAILDGDTRGLLKVHVAKGSGRILGATLVSSHAGESLSELTTAIVHGIKLHQLSKVIHPYPTQAEVIKKAADRYSKKRLIDLKERLLAPLRWFRRESPE